jgi:integrase
MKKERPIKAKTRRGNTIYRNKFHHNGEIKFAEEYTFAVKKNHERHRINLGKDIAKAKAMADQIAAFMAVPSHSFEDLFSHEDFKTLKKPRTYKARSRNRYLALPGNGSNSKHVPLIREIIQRYEANAVDISTTTRKGAVGSLRHLTAQVIGLPSLTKSATKRKIELWRQKTGAVPIDELSLRALEDYRVRLINEAGDDHAEKGKRVTTLNSYFRSARSIFSERMMAFYEDFELPDPLPLRKIRNLREPVRRYVSKIDVEDIISKAKKRFWDREISEEELAERPPSSRSEEDYIREDKARFIILLLTISCGLRPKEIAKLTWDQVDFENSQIHVSVTSYDTPKARNSEASIDVSLPVMAMLRDFETYSIFPPFVIPAPRFGKKEPAKPGQIIFRQLYKWLRKNGVDVESPLYIFRKEAGSIIFEQTDSFDLAAEFLRNDPRIAREYYVSRKRKLLVEVPGHIPREE